MGLVSSQSVEGKAEDPGPVHSLTGKKQDAPGENRTAKIELGSED